MMTPIDIQNHSLKTAIQGYSKKETDDFLEEILHDYEELYKENREIKEKITSLSEGIQYYKQMETTLQKALVLAEKTSAETQDAAKSKAESMLNEAQAKADKLISEAQAYADITKAKANQELEETRSHVRKLVQSYENYRLQFKKLAESQIEMLDSDHFSIFVPELDELMADAPDADAAMEGDGLSAMNVGRTQEKADEKAFEMPIMEESVDDIKARTMAAEAMLASLEAREEEMEEKEGAFQEETSQEKNSKEENSLEEASLETRTEEDEPLGLLSAEASGETLLTAGDDGQTLRSGSEDEETLLTAGDDGQTLLSDNADEETLSQNEEEKAEDYDFIKQMDAFKSAGQEAHRRSQPGGFTFLES